MKLTEHHLLQSERTTVVKLLSAIPEEDVLDRASLEARLGEIERQLENVPIEPARARLTFCGKPVVGTYGIFAEFGAVATKLFSDAVTTMAASLAGPLASKGPIPNRDQSQLLITGTALGSFGFELTEYRPGELPFSESSPTAQALENSQKLLQSTLGSDDDLAEAVTNTNSRAISSLRTFLEHLSCYEAVCALEFGETVFRFKGLDEVRQSLARLSPDNLHEENVRLSGEFQGILPKARTFEFKLAATEEIIRGKIGPQIESPDILNQHLQYRTNAEFLRTKVGNGRPRYQLQELPNWTGSN